MTDAAEKNDKTPEAVNRLLPRLDNCGTYLAKDNKGQWHYLNHANSWCTYQGPGAEDKAHG